MGSIIITFEWIQQGKKVSQSIITRSVWMYYDCLYCYKQCLEVYPWSLFPPFFTDLPPSLYFPSERMLLYIFCVYICDFHVSYIFHYNLLLEVISWKYNMFSICIFILNTLQSVPFWKQTSQGVKYSNYNNCVIECSQNKDIQCTIRRHTVHVKFLYSPSFTSYIPYFLKDSSIVKIKTQHQ